MARIAVSIGIAVMVLIAVLAGCVLLLASIVAWLQPMTGLAAALAMAGVGVLVVAILLLVLQAGLARAERRRRSARDAMVGLVELALMLFPRRHLQRIETGIAAGVGLAALVALLLHRPGDRHDTQD